jgi:hypothetical protein
MVFRKTSKFLCQTFHTLRVSLGTVKRLGELVIAVNL